MSFQGNLHSLVEVDENRYKTEVETYVDIQKIDQNGAAYWQIRQPTGVTYKLGKTSDGSNTNAEIQCNNKTLAWVVEEIQDPHGNTIYFTYNQSPHSGDTHALYPHSITYNNDQKRKITFSMEQSNRPDIQEMYFQECHIRYVRRIQRIQTWYEDQLISEYSLSFDHTGAHSQLQSIKRFGKKGGSLPPTTFTYHEPTKGWNNNSEKWKGGLESLGGYIPGDSALVDVNADGLVDIVTADSVLNPWYVFLNEGNKWDDTPRKWKERGGVLGHHTYKTDSTFADVNNDGLVDIVREDDEWYVYLNKGDKWDDTARKWKNRGGDIESYYGPDSTVIDVNGDDLPDIPDFRKKGLKKI